MTSHHSVKCGPICSTHAPLRFKKTHEPTNEPLSFLSMAQQPNMGLGSIVVEVSSSHKHNTHTHTHRKTTVGKSPLNEWSARPTGRYLHNTQQTQQKNIHALSGIRTRDPSKPAAADLRPRTRALGSALLTLLFSS